MEIRQLRYFLAVVETGSFTKGAEFVAVSQPSLSVQVAALEEELGSPLLDRLGRRVALTEAGRVFLDYAHRIMREMELSRQAVQDLSGAQLGRLVVGAVSTVNSYLIPPLICRFKERFPGVQVQVHAHPSAIIEADLLANRLDVGICLLPVASSRLAASPLFMETLALVAPAAARLPARVRMRDLAKHPLVLLPNDYCLRKLIEAECQRVGVRPNVTIEMTSPEGILEAVKEGAGLTILPELYVRHGRRSTGLKVVSLFDPVPRHSVGLVHLRQRHLGKAAMGLLDLCRLTLKDLKLSKEEARPAEERVPAIAERLEPPPANAGRHLQSRRPTGVIGRPSTQ